MTKYPYYVPVYYSAGVLNRVSKTKYNSFEDAYKVAKPRANESKSGTQWLILEYCAPYFSKICAIISKENTLPVLKPLVE